MSLICSWLPGKTNEKNFDSYTKILATIYRQNQKIMSRKAKDRQTAIVFTGKESRFLALQKEFAKAPNLHLICLPLLETEITLSKSKWIELQSALEQSENLVLAAFSINGIESLRKLLFGEWTSPSKAKKMQEILKKAKWAIVSRRTARALEQCFGIVAEFLSPDETGAGLARLLLNQAGKWQNSTLLALSAERGREEFYEILKGAGIPVQGFRLYESRIRSPKKEELAKIPEEAWLILGSPQIAEAFLAKPELLKPGWRYACLGKTTFGWLRKHGIESPYLASQADYAVLLRELVYRKES